jgi:hypothetical protein
MSSPCSCRVPRERDRNSPLPVTPFPRALHPTSLYGVAIVRSHDVPSHATLGFACIMQRPRSASSRNLNPGSPCGKARLLKGRRSLKAHHVLVCCLHTNKIVEIVEWILLTTRAAFVMLLLSEEPKGDSVQQGASRLAVQVARIMHETPAATADLAVLPGVLGSRTLRRTDKYASGPSPCGCAVARPSPRSRYGVSCIMRARMPSRSCFFMTQP